METVSSHEGAVLDARTVRIALSRFDKNGGSGQRRETEHVATMGRALHLYFGVDGSTGGGVR